MCCFVVAAAAGGCLFVTETAADGLLCLSPSLKDLEAEQQKRRQEKQKKRQKARSFLFRSAPLAGGLIEFQRCVLDLQTAAAAAAAGDSSGLFADDESAKQAAAETAAAAAATAGREPKELLADLLGSFRALLQQLETPPAQQQQQEQQEQQEEEQQRVLPVASLSWFAALRKERPLRRLLWLMGLEAEEGDTCIRWVLPAAVSASTWRDRLHVFDAMHAKTLDVRDTLYIASSIRT